MLSSKQAGASQMNKSFFAGVALLACSIGSAAAADLPAQKLYKPAPPPVLFNWSGCYVGGQIGGQWGNWTAGVYHDVGIDPNIARPSRDLSGKASFIGGGQIGCNYQFAGSSSVIGIEGDIAAPSKNTFSGEVFRFAPLAQIDHIDAAGKIGTQGSVRLRAGVTWDRALLYFAGGATWAELTANHFIVGTAGGTAAIQNGKTKTGWNIGLGFRVRLREQLDRWGRVPLHKLRVGVQLYGPGWSVLRNAHSERGPSLHQRCPFPPELPVRRAGRCEVLARRGGRRRAGGRRTGGAPRRSGRVRPRPPRRRRRACGPPRS